MTDLPLGPQSPVSELRAALRKRGCRTAGLRKAALVGRLAAVTAAEVSTMTVRELRRAMRSRNVPARGVAKKADMVRALVEAGVVAKE